MSPEEIGLEYVRAARILRETHEFGRRGSESLTRVSNTWDQRRTQIHQDSAEFARQVQQMALQVLGAVEDSRFECDFVVNLEFFSRLDADEDDLQALRNIAIWYVPVRVTHYLRIPNNDNPRTPVRRRPWSSLTMVDQSHGIEETNSGLRIQRKVGFLTSASIILASCVPAVIYLALRATKTSVEEVIQTTLAILASTLFILASPVHRSLFNNWSISEALTGRMTLDEDSILNLRTDMERHVVGRDLIAMGKMSLLSSKASYAAPYSSKGLDPGPMDLKTLTSAAAHLLIIDQDGALVLMYDNDHGVELLVDGHEENNKLNMIKAREYRGFRYWHVVRVPESARNCLLH